MKAWIYNGHVVFLPLKGATPVAKADVIEEAAAPVGSGEELGAIDSVIVEPSGKVRIRRKVKPESARSKALKDLDKANNIAQLRAAVKQLL